MNDFQEWLAETKENNSLEVNVRQLGNQFESTLYTLHTADENIPTIYLSTNNEGKISVFDTDTFHFSRFNIAEGFTEENFRDAALMFLAKRIPVKRGLLGRKYVEIKFGNLIAYGKSCSKSKR